VSEKSRLRTFFYGLKGDLRAQITKSNILDFVSRRDAAFSVCAKIGAYLAVQITFSTYMEFVKITARG